MIEEQTFDSIELQEVDLMMSNDCLLLLWLRWRFESEKSESQIGLTGTFRLIYRTKQKFRGLYVEIEGVKRRPTFGKDTAGAVG